MTNNLPSSWCNLC